MNYNVGIALMWGFLSFMWVILFMKGNKKVLLMVMMFSMMLKSWCFSGGLAGGRGVTV